MESPLADETRRDKVNAMFHAKINQIVYVILGECWMIDDSSWQILVDLIYQGCAFKNASDN